MPSPAIRVLEHQLVVYRTTWRGSVVSSFLAPVLYLLAMGVGLGSIIDPASREAHLGGVSYLAFVAPGLLAAAAMQTAVGESMFPIMAGIKWLRTYHAMLAGPIGVSDLVLGQFLWMALRITMVATAYLATITLFGVVDSPLGLLSPFAALLCGMAFAGPIAAFAATQENDQSFALIFRLAVLPLFLFSGTFFPVSQLPALVQPVAWITPLWHGVQLTRGLVLGTLGGGEAVLHVCYLSVCVAAGWFFAQRTFARRLAA